MVGMSNDAGILPARCHRHPGRRSTPRRTETAGSLENGGAGVEHGVIQRQHDAEADADGCNHADNDEQAVVISHKRLHSRMVVYRVVVAHGNYGVGVVDAGSGLALIVLCKEAVAPVMLVCRSLNA